MKSMELTALREALDTWGTDFERWPAATAAAAHQLLHDSSAARAELASAQQMQTTLAALPLIRAPSALKNSIINTVPADRWQQLSIWFSATMWRPALAGALSLLIGFTLGFASGLEQPVTDLDPQLDVSLLAFISDYEDYLNE